MYFSSQALWEESQQDGRAHNCLLRASLLFSETCPAPSRVPTSRQGGRVRERPRYPATRAAQGARRERVHIHATNFLIVHGLCEDYLHHDISSLQVADKHYQGFDC